jgi:tubulin delta
LVSERFFFANEREKTFARAVMVDMEQKVVGQAYHETQRHSSMWSYHKDQQVTGKKGSGNNWAQGYCHHGPKCISNVLDKVSKEAERCDSLGGFLAFMSLAGGTGSGLGAFVTTALRDEYPHATIVNNVIWPYTTGEVIVQNYNAVLTLSHLYSASDGIVFMENEEMQKICSQLLRVKNVSFKDINKVAASKLAGVLLPAFEANDSVHLSKFVIADILSNVCSHPGYKLLNILNIPVVAKTSLAYTSYNWNMLVKHCRQMLIANANMEEGIINICIIISMHSPICPPPEGKVDLNKYFASYRCKLVNQGSKISQSSFNHCSDQSDVGIQQIIIQSNFPPWKGCKCRGCLLLRRLSTVCNMGSISRQISLSLPQE